MIEKVCFSCGIKRGVYRIVCVECGALHSLCEKCSALIPERYPFDRYCSYCPTRERMVAKALEGR